VTVEKAEWHIEPGWGCATAEGIGHGPERDRRRSRLAQNPVRSAGGSAGIASRKSGRLGRSQTTSSMRKWTSRDRLES